MMNRLREIFEKENMRMNETVRINHNPEIYNSKRGRDKLNEREFYVSKRLMLKRWYYRGRL